MWGKLVKYEMKSMMKIFALAWGAIMIVALISGFFTNQTLIRDDNFFFADVVAGNSINAIFLLLYFAIGVGIVVLSLIYIIQRFNKGLLGSEGYLMFTIPTTPRTLITAKGFSATIIVILSCIAGAISGALFMIPYMKIDGIKEFFSELGDIISSYPITVPAVILLIITGIISIINFIYNVYASIALGHLSGKHRTLMSVLAFVGLSVAWNIIETLGLTIMGKLNLVESLANNIDLTDPKNLLVIVLAAVYELIGIVVYHIITEIVLSKKLNLE